MDTCTGPSSLWCINEKGEKAEMLVVAQFPEVQVDHAQTGKSDLRTGMS